MAAVQISGAVWPLAIAGRIGPFKDGSGNLWVIAFDSTPHVVAYKSSDAGATWGTSFAGAATLGNFSLDCVYDGNNIIYVLVQDGSNVLNIYSFTISTTTWTDLYASGTKPTVIGDVSARFPAFLAVRSTGEFVVGYNSTLHNVSFRSVGYARMSSAGVWSAAVRLDANNAAIHYSMRGVVLGASDRVHFAWTQSGGSWEERTLSSGNALDTVNTGGNSPVGSEGRLGGLYYNATLANVVLGTSTTQFVWRGASAASTALTVDATALQAGAIKIAGGAAFFYHPVSSVLYCFYVDNTSADVFVNTCAGGGTTWGTAATQDVATAAAGVSVGLIATGIGVLFNDTNVFFDTYIIAPANQTSYFSPAAQPGPGVLAFLQGRIAAWTQTSFTGVTPTSPAPAAIQPLVRLNRRTVRVARLLANKALILRAPSTPTPTPLVRHDTIHVTRQALIRRARVTRLLANKPAVIRSVVTAIPAVRQDRIHVIGKAVRRSRISRLLANKPVLLRAPSTPTPTPLVRNRVTVTREALTRKARRARLLANRPTVLRAPPTPTQSVEPPQRMFVSREAVRRKARVIRATQNRPTILRAPAVAPAVQPAHQPIVHTTRRSRYIRTQANKPVLLRAPSTPTPTPLVRNRVTVSREAQLRRSRWTCLGRGRRIRPQLLRPPRGGTATPVVTAAAGSTGGRHMEIDWGRLHREDEELVTIIGALVAAGDI